MAVDLADFATQDHASRRDDLLGPLFPAGARTIIAASDGDGKSTFVWWVVRSIVLGIPWCGWWPANLGRQARVLVVDAEQRPHDILRVAQETGITGIRDAVRIEHKMDGFDLTGQDGVDLEAEVGGWRPDLIVLDPWYALHVGDSNEERHVVDVLRVIDRWRMDYGCSVILCAHMRKSMAGQGNRMTKDNIFGANALRRSAEVILGLQFVKPGHSRLSVLKERGGDMRGQVLDLEYARGTGFTVMAQSHTDEVVMALTEAGTALTGPELQAITGMSRGQLARVLERIGDAVERVPGHGRTVKWRLRGKTIDPDQPAEDNVDPFLAAIS